MNSPAQNHPPAGPDNLVLGLVLLWFPLSSETFIFRECNCLRRRGVDLHVYTMYGPSLKGCSKQMMEYDGPICRMGMKAIPSICAAFGRALRDRPKKVWELMRRGLFRRMRNLESLCENIWCFMAGFLLAEQCRRDGINFIHSPWANGPATAAWVASSLAGIPFSFSGRAGDIYPQDGILAEKAAAAQFIRTNNAANINWLARFCPPGDKEKINLIYNSLVFAPAPKNRAPRKTRHILAVGRFVRTKGFPELFTALARLKREKFPVKLTLIGDGNWRRKLEALRKRLGLEDVIDMPGFIPNDQIAGIMSEYSLLVVPSVVHDNGDRDGIPNVIMEALSLGLPVVATDVCGISEVIVDGETGLLVPQRDPAALANAIRAMLEDPARAAELAEAGRRRVLEMFNPENNCARLLELFTNARKASSNG